jgi:hypothetical protein
MLPLHILPKGRLSFVGKDSDLVRQALVMETIQTLAKFILLRHLHTIDGFFRRLPPGAIERDPIPVERNDIVDGFHSISLHLFVGDLVYVSVFEEEGHESFPFFEN